MKKLLLGLTLGWIVLLGWPLQALSCNLILNPSNFSIKSGETVSFRLERNKTHNVCVTPLEDTKIKITGGELVDPGKWVVGKPDVLNFTVKFTNPGNATVRVERYCTKVGLMVVEANGTVVSTPTGTTTVNTPPTTTVNILPAKTEKPVTAETATSPANSPTSYSANNNAEEVPAQSSFLSRLVSLVTLDSLALKLWYMFFLVGMILFIFKLKQIRKPFLVLSVIVLGFYLGGCPDPVGTPFILLMGNSSLFKIALIMLLIPVIVSLVWGRVFCGWICPLGGVQEMVFSDKAVPAVPAQADKYLKLLKYPLLATLLYLTWRTGNNFWAEYEPFKVLFNFEGTIPAIIILAIIILLSIISERPFCRYICPLGAVLTLTSIIAPFKVRVTEAMCKGCKLCSKNICPMSAIKMQDNELKLPIVDNLECIKCLRCEESCRFKAILIDTGVRQGNRKAKIVNISEDLPTNMGK